MQKMNVFFLFLLTIFTFLNGSISQDSKSILKEYRKPSSSILTHCTLNEYKKSKKNITRWRTCSAMLGNNSFRSTVKITQLRI